MSKRQLNRDSKRIFLDTIDALDESLQQRKKISNASKDFFSLFSDKESAERTTMSNFEKDIDHLQNHSSTSNTFEDEPDLFADQSIADFEEDVTIIRISFPSPIHLKTNRTYRQIKVKIV